MDMKQENNYFTQPISRFHGRADVAVKYSPFREIAGFP